MVIPEFELAQTQVAQRLSVKRAHLKPYHESIESAAQRESDPPDVHIAPVRDWRVRTILDGICAT